MLGRRSKLELDMGRPVDAEADAIKALALDQRSVVQGGASRVLGRTYLSLAKVEAANAKRDDGKHSAAKAADQLQPTLGPDHADTRLAERLAASVAPAP